MYCATCRAEFRPGVERCSDCGGELLPGDLPPPRGAPPPGPPPKTVSVFTSPDPGVFELACSILDTAGVTYATARDGLQDLFGAGRLGTGYNLLVGPEEIHVPERDAERARKLLDQVGGEVLESAEEDEEDQVFAEPSGEPPPPETTPADLLAPQARSAFRFLIVADLALRLFRWFVVPRWAARISDDTWGRLDAALPSPEWVVDYRIQTDIVFLGLYVVAAIGLSTFFSWARILYVLLLAEALVLGFIAGPAIDYGIHSSATLLGRWLSGALVALSFYGPIARAFERRPRESG